MATTESRARNWRTALIIIGIAVILGIIARYLIAMKIIKLGSEPSLGTNPVEVPSMATPPITS